jgi:hypothetical protein
VGRWFLKIFVLNVDRSLYPKVDAVIARFAGGLLAEIEPSCFTSWHYFVPPEVKLFTALFVLIAVHI